MIIREEYPPNIKEIEKVFDIKDRKDLVFTYGDKLYNPYKIKLVPHLIIHETVHSEQQKDPKEWWDKYLKDPDFRLEQELEAYAKQYAYAKPQLNAKGQELFLEKISFDLSSEVYGNIVSYQKAESDIRRIAKSME